MRDLTIIMPTYNKAEFIAEALDSVFAQVTSHPYEVVVADDCSTDGTLEIAERYAAAHPDIVRVLRSSANRGLYRNVVRAYAEMRTPFFCVLDPDDFWTDVHLVQRALDHLAAHPDFTVYSANCRVLEPDGSARPYVPVSGAVDSTFESWLDGRGVLGQTAGLFYRNVVFANGLPEQLRRSLRPDQEMTFRGDGFRNVIHLHEGKAHFDPRQSATYRITPEGLWQGVPEFRREVMNILLFLNLDEYFGRRDRELCVFIGRRLSSIEGELPRLLATAADVGDAAECLGLFRAYQRRFRLEHDASRRFAAGLSLRNRALHALWAKLGLRAERKNWM